MLSGSSKSSSSGAAPSSIDWEQVVILHEMLKKSRGINSDTRTPEGTRKYWERLLKCVYNPSNRTGAWLNSSVPSLRWERTL